MENFTKNILFAVCLTVVLLTGDAVNSRAQEAPASKSQTTVKNVLADIVRAKGGNESFALITPDDLAKLPAAEKNTLIYAGDPCSEAVQISIGQKIGGALDNTDCRLDDGTYADFYAFNGNQGQAVTIQMDSSSIDSYLGLANQSGTFVLEDDDSGGGLSARIQTTLPETGLYIILANSAVPGFGGYALTLSGAAPCTFSVSPTAATVPGEGGTFSFNVVTQPECQWRAVSVNSFTTTNSAGTGSGTVTYTVSQNGSGQTRSGSISVASAPLRGLESYFTITQPTVACSYSLVPSSVNIGATATNGSFSIVAPAGCPWTAESYSGFVSARSSGSGNGTISFSAMHNNGAPRVGIVGVAGLSFTINQAGLNCDFKILPNPIRIGRMGGTRTINIDVQPGCIWSAAANTPFIQLLNNSGTGAGTITFKVSALTELNDRSGAIQVDYLSGSRGVYIDQSKYFLTPVADFDADGRADLTVYRPSNGVWYLNGSKRGFSAVQFGTIGDAIAPADFDGDGVTDIAVFRPSTGNWFILNSANNTFASVQFGANGDKPAPADFDADGRADLAVFRPSNGVWYQLRSSAGFSAVQFGAAEDRPVAGDYDGDGKFDVAVYRPSNGVWYQLRSTQGFYAVQFGTSEDRVVPADYDGDGKSDVAVFRPSSGTWYFLYSTTYSGFYSQQFGTSEDLPAPADYDGDGRADIAVFRPSNGVWYQMRSSMGFSAAQFGTLGDLPAPNAFVR